MTNEAKILAVFILDYDLASSDPKWSSWHLGQLFTSFLEDQRGTMTELIRGLDLALNTGNVQLTESVANLIQDVGRLAFAKYREAYDRAEWGWVVEELAGEVSPARAYLFLRTLPPESTTPDMASTILRCLSGTSRYAEAVATLAQELEPSAVQHERG